MSDEKLCPQCQKSLPSSAPAGLCPECLMQMAMKSDTIPSLTAVGSAADQNRTTAITPDSEMPLDMTVSRGGAGPGKAHNFPPGTQLGDFTLHRKLGEGGMGTVFEAFDAKTKRRVALKILKHQLNTPEARKRFLREGRTAASINHPNSVYVFGTDNIDGKLVISMELVVGGNLQDHVRRNGPMPYRQAVDAILQIIDGLEAAAKVNVLHRDVKPSNCFIDSNGQIKVGDFGLSISTQGTEDSLITGENSILGTPAFSSPEQLRGDDLDLRADIYSLGVTLFYLLTGEVPFTARTFTQLLATVLEKDAPPVSELRKGIPRDVTAAIQRCLAKTPEARWKNYDELRQALLPHSTESPKAASLAKRSLANIIDLIPLQMLGMTLAFTVGFGMSGNRTTRVLFMFSSYAIAVLYYALSESWKGQTIGKAVLGLKTVDQSRNVPTFSQAAFRATVYVTFPSLIAIPTNLFAPPSLLASYWGVAIGLAWFVLKGILFCGARNSNGYAGLHELLTGTRVIETQAAQLKRETLKSRHGMSPKFESQTRVGPYHVLESIDTAKEVSTKLAYDPRLLRRVWIRQSSTADDVSLGRRQVNRVGRLRWLNGFHDGSSTWNAFEAVEGRPVLNLIKQPRKWKEVRAWLLDLAAELEVAERDQSLPTTISLQNLWITTDGKLKLLDFPSPGLDFDARNEALATEFDTRQAGFGRAFLRHLADASLRLSEKPRSEEYVRPWHATEFLEPFRRKRLRKHGQRTKTCQRSGTLRLWMAIQRLLWRWLPTYLCCSSDYQRSLLGCFSAAGF